MVHLHTEGPGPHLAPEMAPHFRHRALFIGPNARAAVNEGRADYVPVFLSDVPRLFQSGALPLDAVLRERDAPRRQRILFPRDVGRGNARRHPAPRTVIVQLNSQCRGRSARASSTSEDIDLAVEVDEPPYEIPTRDRRVERQIGAYVAELVPDGATLQLGIGAIPPATARP